MKVSYTIHERQHTYETTDPATAEAFSRRGLRVTAEVTNDDA